MKRIAVVLCLVSAASGAWAQLPLGVGTWLRRSSTVPMMLVIEPAGAGFKLSYRMLAPNGAPIGQGVMTIVTALDGTDAPITVDGKETGQSMAIRRIDARHTATVLKMQGKEIGTSKSELSPDGRTLKVDNDMSMSNPGAQQTTEYWDKK